MHSMLFVASMPDESFMNTAAARPLWTMFIEAIGPHINRDVEVLRLSENVWLVDIAKSIPALARMISTAEDQGIFYRLLPFEHEPQWLPVGSDPKPTPDRNDTT